MKHMEEQQGEHMDTEEKPPELARIIRYTKLDNGYLSKLDRKKNILSIDREGRDLLPRTAQDRLDCSDANATVMIMIGSTPHFKEI